MSEKYLQRKNIQFTARQKKADFSVASMEVE